MIIKRHSLEKERAAENHVFKEIQKGNVGISPLVQVELPDDVPMFVKSQYGENAKSLQTLYGKKSLKLRRGHSNNDDGDYVIVNNKTLKVGGSNLFKELRDPDVIGSLKNIR